MPSGIGHFRWGRIALVLGSLYSFIRSPFWVFCWRIRLAAYGARLERVLGSRPRGFKSPILRSFPGFEFSRSGIFVFGVLTGFYCGVVPCVVGVAFRPGGPAF